MRFVNNTGTLISPTSPCPKCGSFMYMPREKGKVHYYLCRHCGFKGLRKRDFSWEAIKIYLERFWFWKLVLKIKRIKYGFTRKQT
jgi:ribosomal protein L37E